MNHTTTHVRWRVLPVHLVAKLFGVLIKVEGMPFGSNRTHLANPPRREEVVGGQLAACASNSPPPDRDRDALVVILTQVICQASESFGRTSPSSSAQAAALAFRAGLDTFTSLTKPMTGTGVADIKSLDRVSELQRLADAAGNLAFSPINESTAQSHCQQGCSGTASNGHTQHPKNPSAPDHP